MGIGHLITEDDELYGFEVGTTVSQEHVDELFYEDTNELYEIAKYCTTISTTCLKRHNTLRTCAFQLGVRINKVHEDEKAVDNRDWPKPAARCWTQMG